MLVLDMTYDEDRDAFIPKKPFNSWILNEHTCYGKHQLLILQMDKNTLGTRKIKAGLYKISKIVYKLYNLFYI
jgi:hypothetical protein